MRGKGENWRWRKILDCIGVEGEVGLQKWIALLTGDEVGQCDTHCFRTD
jgi:hypothetical protein